MMTDIFTEYATKHEQALEGGNYRSAHKLHFKLAGVYNEIKRDGKWQELKEMAQHSNDSVKLWAATFLLHSDSEFALHVLHELTKSSKTIGFTASVIIEMWRKRMP